MIPAAERARVTDLLWGFFPAQVIRTLAALAERIGTRPDALGRLLRAAAGLELLDRDAGGRWRLTAGGELLRTGAPGSVGHRRAPGRCEIVTGDFFTAVPPGDAHVVKSVVHDWDDERSIAILAGVRAATPEHGRLFLVEPVLTDEVPELPAQRVTLMSDLTMLVCTGGRERTLAEFTALLDAAGLRLVDVRRVPPPTGFSVLRAEPA